MHDEGVGGHYERMASTNRHHQFGLAIVGLRACWKSVLAQGRAAYVVVGVWACSLALFPVLGSSFADATDVPPPAAVGRLEETNYQELLHSVMRVEGQLRSNQLTVEQSALEAKLAASRSAEALSNGLQAIDRAFSAQQEVSSARSGRELEAMRNSNRVMLIAAGSFAAMVSLAMLMIAYGQWRMSRAWADISAALPTTRGLSCESSVPGLGTGEAHLAPVVGVGGSKLRLLGAMEQLERRVRELEQSSEPVLKPQAISPGDNGDSPAATDGARPSRSVDQYGNNESGRIRALLKQGQARLKENDPESALVCFDEVLLLNPNQGEALVKKGAALERMHKLNEAFDCYDRAIKADESMTVAYLHKGGLCSRLERFKEALECYEKALRTHDDFGGGS